MRIIVGSQPPSAAQQAHLDWSALALHERPIPAVHYAFLMLQCGPSNKTFAAGSKLRKIWDAPKITNLDVVADSALWHAIFRLLSTIVHDFKRLVAQSDGMTYWILIVLAVLVTAQWPSAAFADGVLWRMNSVLHPQLFGESARVFAEEVGTLSDGEFMIEVHNQLILDVNAFGALRSGLVDAVWASPGHHHREDPALTIFGGFPFGPDPQGFTAWMQDGGGTEALNMIYARHGMRSIYCGVLPAESGGWFRSPIESVDDLNGLTMRSFGYGARTLQNLGVTTFELPASDIRPAFENGVIDAAEFAMPSIDAMLGFVDFAPYLYVPGWQQPSTSLELLVLETTWLSLSDSHRQIVMGACEASLRWGSDVAAQRQEVTIRDFRAKGVQIHEFPDQILKALKQSWTDVIENETAADPDLNSAWQSYLSFELRQGTKDQLNSRN